MSVVVLHTLANRKQTDGLDFNVQYESLYSNYRLVTAVVLICDRSHDIRRQQADQTSFSRMNATGINE